VNDNPVIDHRNNNIFHGGNFHGDYVALEMDKLRIAVTKFVHAGRKTAELSAQRPAEPKFPPFVNLGMLGLNFGMQGVQFTATSTVAENQTLSFPMYVHSIPNNNDNQDIVSMGANAALLTKKVIDNSFRSAEYPADVRPAGDRRHCLQGQACSRHPGRIRSRKGNIPDICRRSP
jgi:histidine ammonia-lyase